VIFLAAFLLADYLLGYTANGSDENIDLIHTSEGIAFKKGNAYHYNLQDHLGNVCFVLKKDGSALGLLSVW